MHSKIISVLILTSLHLTAYVIRGSSLTLEQEDELNTLLSLPLLTAEDYRSIASSSSSSSSDEGSVSTTIQPVSSKYSCSVPVPATEKKLNDWHLRGTSLGGWLVIEPWITPSLFYQFLGASSRWGDAAKDHVGLDGRTFCLALGKEEANRQLRNHWRTWVTEEQIATLANEMNVRSVRIPIADWIFSPYEPFNGCWDGALDELFRVLGLCRKYDIKAILDLHGVRKSQVRSNFESSLQLRGIDVLL